MNLTKYTVSICKTQKISKIFTDHLASEAHSSLQLRSLRLLCQHCDRMERCSYHPRHSHTPTVFGLGFVYVLGLSGEVSLSSQGPVGSTELQKTVLLYDLKDSPPS